MHSLEGATIYDWFDVTEDYLHIVHQLCIDLHYTQGSVRISDSPCGELVIFHRGNYAGYLDDYLNFGKDWFLDKGGCTTSQEYDNFKVWQEAHAHCDQGSWDCPDPEDCPHKKMPNIGYFYSEMAEALRQKYL